MSEILREDETLEQLEKWIKQLDTDEDSAESYKKELDILRTILWRYNYIRSCNHSYKRKMRVLTGIFKHTLEYTIEKFICEGDPDLSNCFSKK